MRIEPEITRQAKDRARHLRRVTEDDYNIKTKIGRREKRAKELGLTYEEFEKQGFRKIPQPKKTKEDEWLKRAEELGITFEEYVFNKNTYASWKNPIWKEAGIEPPLKGRSHKEYNDKKSLAKKIIQYKKDEKFFKENQELIAEGLIFVALRKRIKDRIRYKKYRLENLEQEKERKRVIAAKPETKKKRNKELKKRRREDPVFKLVSVMRSSMANSFRKRGWEKKTRTEEIIGLPFDEFIAHLISHPSWEEEHFTLENHGEIWQIDHEYAISNAKTEDDVIALNRYTNLKPMWKTTDIAKAHGVLDKIGNLNKGNRLEE
jgi:hypothetical protein